MSVSGHRDPALRAGHRPLISPPRVRLVLPRTWATLGGPFYLDSYVKSANAEYHARITLSRLPLLLPTRSSLLRAFVSWAGRNVVCDTIQLSSPRLSSTSDTLKTWMINSPSTSLLHSDTLVEKSRRTSRAVKSTMKVCELLPHVPALIAVNSARPRVRNERVFTSQLPLLA